MVVEIIGIIANQSYYLHSRIYAGKKKLNKAS